MPAYFKFLTVMAFHVFLKEEVDVAIVEVGIGGEYDCTNFIRYDMIFFPFKNDLMEPTKNPQSYSGIQWKTLIVM